MLAISYPEMGTAQPDVQNVLQISKLAFSNWV